MSEEVPDMPVVGVVGGGQLARMTQQAAIPLGVSLRVLADGPGDSAARVCPLTVVGDYRRLDDLRAFAKGCDVVTFDHEHVPGAHLDALAGEGVLLRPGPAALHHAQDKLAMRARLGELGVACPRYRPVSTMADIEEFVRAGTTGWPVVVKAVRGGYDGKGVWVCGTAEQAAEVLGYGVPLLVEEFVPFRRELAALVARSAYGQGAAYPVVETVQRGGICHEVIAPAPGLAGEQAARAQRIALELAAGLGVVGLLAVELFETAAGELLVNELAMRPHNSGHWTIDGALTSQFEQHLRAVLDLPLGSVTPTAPCVAMVNVLGGADPDVYSRYVHVLAKDPGIKLHMYGKSVRPGRKIGHVTATGADPAETLARARDAAGHLRGGSG